MPKPEELELERRRVHQLALDARLKLEEAAKSKYWSYTREWELGMLQAAINATREVLKRLRR